MKPFLLLADSQLLFRRGDYGDWVLRRICSNYLDLTSCHAVYIGASNGDIPEFYALFLSAMENFGITTNRCKHITSDYNEAEQLALKTADLILLAGGNVADGISVFENTNLRKDLLKKYQDGCMFIGLSAGAVQLGWEHLEDGQVTACLKLIPLNIGAHDEANHWKSIKALIQGPASIKRAIGIPTGGGFLYHPDHTLEPIGMPLAEFVIQHNTLEETLIINT